MAYRRLGVLVPRDAHQQEAAASPVTDGDLRPGDLLFYGEEGRADHVAFWLGDGRIPHATGHEGVAAVVAEPEPESLRTRGRRAGRFASNP
jgi:cell wall-associated NlpC family hydrolase